MPEWIQLVLLGVGMELARIAGVYDRAGPVARVVGGLLKMEKRRLEAERVRLQRPAFVRHETRWKISRTDTGRVALILEEYVHTTAESGGRLASTRALLPEPTGSELWSAVMEQRDTLVEKTLAEGTRVFDLEKGL